MNRVRVGMIGSGFATDFHTEALKQVHRIDVQITAVTSQNSERAAAFAARHGISRVYPSYEALLQDPNIDVVDLCVPNHLHDKYSICRGPSPKTYQM
jgi:predicted dehydrogenase